MGWGVQRKQTKPKHHTKFLFWSKFSTKLIQWDVPPHSFNLSVDSSKFSKQCNCESELVEAGALCFQWVSEWLTWRLSESCEEVLDGGYSSTCSTLMTHLPDEGALLAKSGLESLPTWKPPDILFWERLFCQHTKICKKCIRSERLCLLPVPFPWNKNASNLK